MSFRKADASTMRTSRAMNSSATRASSVTSLGEWIRFAPQARSGPARQPRLNVGQARLHGVVRKAAGAEEAQHPGLRHRHHEGGRRDAIRHGSGDIRKTGPVRFAELTVAQPLRVDRGQRPHEGDLGRAGAY